LADSIQYLFGQGTANHGLSIVYRIQGDFKQALFYAFRALQDFEKLNDTHKIADLYNNIGTIYFDANSGYNSLAKKYFIQALTLGKQLNESSSALAVVYNNLGEIEFSNKNYAESIRYYKKALTDSSGTSDNTTLMMYNIGRAYLEIKNFEH